MNSFITCTGGKKVQRIDYQKLYVKRGGISAPYFY